MRVRPYEKPMLLVAAALCAALALLVPFATNQPGPAAVGPPGPTPPERHATAADDAPEDAANAAHASARGEGSGRAGKPATPSPLCSGSAGVSALFSSAAAIAVDAAGRFAFYGLPDPNTGAPTPDSHVLLRGCERAEARRSGGAPLLLNPVRVGVGGGEPVALGPQTLSAKTRRTDGAASTVHAPAESVRVTQTLALVAPDGPPAPSTAPDTLRASYRIENRAHVPTVVRLSAVLAPARGPFSKDNSGVAYFANNPPPVGAVSITRPRTFAETWGETPEEIIVPRPGAAASSTSYWRPLGRAPERISFGAATDLASAGTTTTTGRNELPRASAFEATWDAVTVSAGGSATVAYEYGRTSGWPGP